MTQPQMIGHWLRNTKTLRKRARRMSTCWAKFARWWNSQGKLRGGKVAQKSQDILCYQSKKWSRAFQKQLRWHSRGADLEEKRKRRTKGS